METGPEPLKTTVKRFAVVVLLSIAFGYIEAAVVVYLRTIFHPGGFTFPLTSAETILDDRSLLLTEIGREAATLVLIAAGAWLAGRGLQERAAYFMVIFAVWDIFYYVWLKVLINWPASMTDWDILFLIPSLWASAVLYPAVVSIAILVIGGVILYRCGCGRPLKVTASDVVGFSLASVVVVISFCTAGAYVTKADFAAHFYPVLFWLGYLSGAAVFVRCLLRGASRRQGSAA